MRKSILLVLVLCVSISSYSQKKDKTIITIDGEKTKVSEFKRVYEKNLGAIDSDEAKRVTKNIALYINYRLKVKEAYSIKLDTLPSYKREIETYRYQLSEPYLRDTTFRDQLVKDAYFRTKNEVKAKHILIRLSKEATAKDTLVAYNKIIDIRNSILKGGDFEASAMQSSEDKSARDDPKSGRRGNKGNLGYFSAFRMVYPFEAAAYSTKVGEVSMPFRTQYGYHILKVDAFRESRGELEVAHILIPDTTAVGKIKIDEVYAKLLKKEKFEALAKQYSKDSGTKDKGGKLNRFGAGRMVKPFEDAAYSLTVKNSFSNPFKTPFGWHIVKLLEKYPVADFAEMKEKLTQKVKGGDRMKLSVNAVVERLKGTYKIIENEAAKSILERVDVREMPKDSLQAVLLSVNDKKIKQEAFVTFLKNKRGKPVFELFEEFKDKHILTYYKDNLKYTEPAYAQTIKEYEDGLLLFELMKQKIWDKSSKDSLGLQNYFAANLTKYKTKELKEIKGDVMNDYQNDLEANWIADLRRRSKIKVNKKELKKLVRLYEQKQ
jgi:peptidyl-prolyl cis-trans isomerase SurA